MYNLHSEHLCRIIHPGVPCVRTGPARHVVAWLRGCCYLAAGNSRQALRDARTAMAYATAAAADNIPASGPVRPAPQGPAAEEHTDNTATGPTPAAAAAQGAGQSCGWFPALLLAGQAYADLDDHAQAVLHLAKVWHRLSPKPLVTASPLKCIRRFLSTHCRIEPASLPIALA